MYPLMQLMMLVVILAENAWTFLLDITGVMVLPPYLISAAYLWKLSSSGDFPTSGSEGKGFAFIIIAMGVVETVGIFTMVFMLGVVPKLPEAAEAEASLVSWLPL